MRQVTNSSKWKTSGLGINLIKEKQDTTVSFFWGGGGEDDATERILPQVRKMV